MDRKYAKKGLTIVAAEVQGNPAEEIAKMAKDKKMGYTVTKGIRGPNLSNGIPHMAVFDTKGKLVFSGHPTDGGVEKAIKDALKDAKADDSSSSGSGSIFDKKKDLVAERSWTNSEGKTIKATLESLDNDTGHFKFPNGKKFDYDITKLSAADQEVIKEAAGGAASASE